MGKADGHRCTAPRSTAPASPGNAQAEGGASAQSWFGGPGWRRLLPTAAHDNRGALARRRATSYCFAVPRHAPARGRYPTETPSLRALGLVCTAQASGGDGPSGLSLTGPGMRRDAARGPVLHLRQRPSCPPCPALVQRPCHPQPPPRVCRPWAAHPAAGSGFPGQNHSRGLQGDGVLPAHVPRSKLPCPAFPALPHTRVCTRGIARDRCCKRPSVNSNALFPGTKVPRSASEQPVS